MFKKAADTEAFLKRVANHSMTGSRRGDSGHLSNEPDVSYTVDNVTRQMITMEEVNRQIDFARWEKTQLTLQMQKVNAQLAETLPLHKYKPLNKRRRTIIADIAQIESHLGELKEIRRNLHDDKLRPNHNTWAEVFKSIALSTLPANVYEKLSAATEEVMRVKHKNVKSPLSE